MATNPKLDPSRPFGTALVRDSRCRDVHACTRNFAGRRNSREIVVTGSRIRRVEAETASPVFIVDREAIEASGVTTMGELLQQDPDRFRRRDQHLGQQRRRRRRIHDRTARPGRRSARWCC